LLGELRVVNQPDAGQPVEHHGPDVVGVSAFDQLNG
jgi:hypothetical protein